jgi:hypothetical protein
MSHPTTLSIDSGATSIKSGVSSQERQIIRHGNVVPTRQDGEFEPLIRSIGDEISRLQQEDHALEAVGKASDAMRSSSSDRGRRAPQPKTFPYAKPGKSGHCQPPTRDSEAN